MRELTLHHKQLCDELIASGLQSADAEKEAGSRLGLPNDIAARLNAAHNTSSWRSALLAAAPFVVSAVFLVLHTHSSRIAGGLLISMGIVFLLGCVRELVKGRRPIWLSTWSAAILLYAWALLPDMRAHIAPHTNNSWFCLTSMACGIAVFALIAAWCVRRWRMIVTPLALVCLTLGLYAFAPGQHSLIVPAVVFSDIALLVFLARCVYEVHPYGNGARASLFILSFLTLFWITGTVGHATLTACQLLCAGGIVLFARVSTHHLKRIAIAASIACPLILLILLDAHPASHIAAITVIKAVLALATYIYAIVLYVGIPMKYEDRRQHNTPSVAR